MARQKIPYTVPGEHSEKPGHRDAGKVFIITEPSADQGERLSAIAKALLSDSLKVPAPSADIGEAAGLASIGIDFTDPRVDLVLLHPSLEPLMDCVKYQHNPKHPLQVIASGENSVIEEIGTRKLLRKEVLCLFLGFFAIDSAPASESHQTRAT